MRAARLTLLGTGTSTGVPQIRCDCRVCRSTDPADRRTRSSALLRFADGGPSILIDATPDLRMQLLRLGSPVIDAALITHSHYDHVGARRPAALLRGPRWGFPLVCSADVEADLRARIPYCFREVVSPRVPRFAIVRAEPCEPLQVAGVEILPLPVVHAGPLIHAYRIGAFGYVTDCKEMPSDTLKRLRGVDTLVINALRHTPIPPT